MFSWLNLKDIPLCSLDTRSPMQRDGLNLKATLTSESRYGQPLDQLNSTSQDLFTRYTYIAYVLKVA